MSEFNIIVQADALKEWVDTFTTIVDEAKIHIHEDGIEAFPVDPANISSIDQTLHASGCESYEVQSEGMTVGLNITRLDDYLDHASSDDLVKLSYDGETRRLVIDYETDTGNVHYKMAGIDPDSIRQDQSVEEADITSGLLTDVRIDGAALKHAVDIAGDVSDHILLDSDPDRENPLHIVGQGDTDDSRVKFSKALKEGSDIPESCQALFSEDYLSEMVTAIPKDADVRLQHGDEWPLRIEYDYNGGARSTIMMLAPRIQSD